MKAFSWLKPSLIAQFCVLGVMFVVPSPSAASQGSVSAPITSLPSFAVASVKQNLSHDGRWKLEFTADGLSALGVSLRQLVEEAYGIYNDDRILGIAREFSDQRYDIEARVDEADLKRYQSLGSDERRVLLQRLLADRFQLSSHLEDRMRPVYKLTVAKNGPKLKMADSNVPHTKGDNPVPTIKHVRRGHLEAEQFTLPEFAKTLSILVERHVVDATSLQGRYNLILNWNPDDRKVLPDALPQLGAGDDLGPSIFTAIREQLGLQLIPAKGLVKVVVVDNASFPTQN